MSLLARRLQFISDQAQSAIEISADCYTVRAPAVRVFRLRAV